MSPSCAQVVQADPPYASLLKRRVEEPSHPLLAVRKTDVVAEHQVEVCPRLSDCESLCRLDGLPDEEAIDQVSRHRDRPFRSVCFRMGEPEPRHHLAHVLRDAIPAHVMDVLRDTQLAPAQIEVTPPLGEVLSRAQPAVQADQDRQLVFVARERLDQAGRLGRRQVLHLMVWHVGRINPVDRVHGNQPPLHGTFKSGVQTPMDMEHALRRKPTTSAAIA